MKVFDIRVQAVAVVLALFSMLAQAADPAPAQFSFLDFNAPDNNDVKGVRLAALYGKTGNVTGIDFSFGLSEVDNLKGISFPVVFGANRINTSMTGLGMGIVNLHKGSDKGVNLGLINLTNDVEGVNIGFLNVSTGDTLADVSAVNISDTSTFQLAFFNKTEILKGLQIGLLNCASNGFLPCFPIFNFASD